VFTNPKFLILIIGTAEPATIEGVPSVFEANVHVTAVRSATFIAVHAACPYVIVNKSALRIVPDGKTKVRVVAETEKLVKAIVLVASV